MRHLLTTLFLLLISTTVAAQSVTELITHYNADRGALNRKYSVQPSDEYFDRFERFYTDQIERLESIRFEDLSPDSRADYLLFHNSLSRSLYFLQDERRQYQRIAHYLPSPDEIIAFVQERRRGTLLDAQEVAERMNAWFHQAGRVQAELTSAGPLTRRDAAYLSRAISALADAVEEAYSFYHGYSPDFNWWVESPFEQVAEAFEELADVAGSHYDAEREAVDESGITGNPIGEEEINRRLAFEMISYTPQELIEIANEQYDWTMREMLKASDELGFGDDWKAALEYVKTTYVPAGSQPQLVQELAEEAVGFLEERELVTIPELAKETWRMMMLSPEWQRIAPFFLGGEVVRIAYPTNTMTHEEKMMSMRGNNPHFSKAVVHHELIPGHHLQQFMNQRYNTQRRMFRTPFWTEGWALYWEFLLWEEGFASSPEDRVGMLYWRMHRAARIVFSLNYHLGNWTPQQSIDYLVDRVGHERANAEAEVRRSFEGNYGPLYQIAYMVGAMQLYSLRMEMVDSGRMSDKEFHDTILKHNSIPVAMVRALLTGRELTPEFDYTWMFGDYIQGM